MYEYDECEYRANREITKLVKRQTSLLDYFSL